jgi:hypothetical protein
LRANAQTRAKAQAETGGKLVGTERCHEEATRTASVPTEPHGPRRCGGPEHSAGYANANHLAPGRYPARWEGHLPIIADYRSGTNVIATVVEINRQKSTPHNRPMSHTDRAG